MSTLLRGQWWTGEESVAGRRFKGFTSLSPADRPARYGRRMSDRPDKRSKPDFTMGVAVAIGVAIGAAIGAALDNIALGIGVGVAIGIALGVAVGNQG